MGVHQWARQTVEQGLKDLEAQGFERPLALRALLSAVIERSLAVRSTADLAAELQFIADNLDDERDYGFMRP